MWLRLRSATTAPLGYVRWLSGAEAKIVSLDHVRWLSEANNSITYKLNNFSNLTPIPTYSILPSGVSLL
ncbi:MAG: hypothetical protein ACJAZY_001024 [Spirosomataceae bacterium]|jgi:hypothetical protein